MRDLDFGIFDVTEIPDDHGPAATAAALESHLADAQIAERAGFKYFFFIEHQNAGFPCISAPTVYLTALARATRTIRLGAMIFQLPLHHPIRLAQDVAMIDHLSHGRIEFGVGYGTRAREFEPWKLAFADRRALGQEALDIVLKAWTDGTVSYQGAHWTFERAQPQPRPYQRPFPPIWLGAHSLSSFDYAAANNFHVAQIFESEQAVAEKFAYFREAWQKQNRSGPRPRALLVRHMHVAESDGQARDEATRYMLNGIQGAAGVERARTRRSEETNRGNSELGRIYLETTKSAEFWFDEGLAFVGSPETVTQAIRAQQARCGYDVLLLNRFHGLPHDLYTKSLRLFGERVIPAFAQPERLSAASA
jgi:alkanesulfonate monooxygenase SsuD/methylene tetrahydromethanopterin reductase-like flavin-dependent oxidoreductase (luciferase family)